MTGIPVLSVCFLGVPVFTELGSVYVGWSSPWMFVDFILPIFYGDNIVIETRVSHIGHKSFTLKQRAINQKTGLEVCQCSTVMVCFNLKTQQSAELPEAYRKAFEAYENSNK